MVILAKTTIVRLHHHQSPLCAASVGMWFYYVFKSIVQLGTLFYNSLWTDLATEMNSAMTTKTGDSLLSNALQKDILSKTTFSEAGEAWPSESLLCREINLLLRRLLNRKLILLSHLPKYRKVILLVAEQAAECISRRKRSPSVYHTVKFF